jgi:FlaA1/EpsC-like NDP-sugar epimerase
LGQHRYLGEYYLNLQWRFFIKRGIAFLHDLSWVPLSLLLSYWLRFNFESIPLEFLYPLIALILFALPIQAVTFWLLGLYRGIWRFASIPDLVRILKSVLIGVIITFSLHMFFYRLEGVPRSVLLLYPIFLALALMTPRLLYRLIRDHHLKMSSKEEQRALILGAGRAGELLVRDLLRSGDLSPVGFLDDNPDKHGRDIHGVRVLNSLDALGDLARQLAIDCIIIAIPSADSNLMRSIHSQCKELGLRCLTLPSISEIREGGVQAERLREIQIEDLLGREVIGLDDVHIHGFLHDRRVMVTGAGGSIGSELCRQVIAEQPEQLILVDNNEFNLYRIDLELTEVMCMVPLVTLLGDVRDFDRMDQIFKAYRPDVVFHAAAYKHVPLVEANPLEGLKTNVLGTRIIADLSVTYMVNHFVLVSTDKAVNPTNVMGASKRMAEVYCQALDSVGTTRFITTRFGNVLDSAGSVVPLFKEQIKKGGPVTVTHPEVTRYFMTIPEAVSLVIQAASMGQGGEIYVLDMGKPVRITDLASQMIQLSGLRAGEDIKIEYIGLRPGEKLYEELFHEAESLRSTDHPKILLAQSRDSVLNEVKHTLDLLSQACKTFNSSVIMQVIKKMVPEFTPDFEELPSRTKVDKRNLLS